MKAKFGNLNFDSVETLSREEMKKVKGGYLGDTGDGTISGFNVYYTLHCSCTEYNLNVRDWDVPGVRYEGCSSVSNARSVCSQNYPGTSHCINMWVTTC